MLIVAGEDINKHKLVLSIIFELIFKYNLGLLVIDARKFRFKENSIPFSKFFSFEKV